MTTHKRAGNVNVLVTIDEAHRGKLAAVAADLEQAGMTVGETFELGGVIAGKVPTRMVGKLRSLEGVQSVEEEPIFETRA